MSQYINEFIKVAYFIGMSFVLAFVLLAAVYVLSFTSKVDFEKSSAYECGFQPFSETNYPFEVQFALIAILFLLFDIEILYLYPLCTLISQFNGIEILYLIVFFAIVTLGLLYEISKNIVNFQISSKTSFRQTYDHKHHGFVNLSFPILFSLDSSFVYVLIILSVYFAFYLLRNPPMFLTTLFHNYSKSLGIILISLFLFLIIPLSIIYYGDMIYHISPIIYYIMASVIYIFMLLFVYIQQYTWRNLPLSVSSFICFSIIVIQLTLYLLAISVLLNMVYNNNSKSIYLADLSVLSQYRYLLLSIISVFFILLFIFSRIFKLDIQRYSSVISYPYLQEEFRCFFDTWKEAPVGKLFTRVLVNLTISTYWRHLFFLLDLLMVSFRFFSLLLFISCCFFDVNFFYLLYLVPFNLFFWLLGFFLYYLHWIIEGNSNFIRDCLVLSPLDSSLLPEGKTGFSFKITPQAVKEGFSEKDLDFLVNQWLRYGNLTVYFRYRQYVKYFSSIAIILYFIIWCYLSYHFFFSTYLETIITGSSNLFVAAFRRSVIWKPPVGRMLPRDMRGVREVYQNPVKTASNKEFSEGKVSCLSYKGYKASILNIGELQGAKMLKDRLMNLYPNSQIDINLINSENLPINFDTAESLRQTNQKHCDYLIIKTDSTNVQKMLTIYVDFKTFHSVAIHWRRMSLIQLDQKKSLQFVANLMTSTQKYILDKKLDVNHAINKLYQQMKLIKKHSSTFYNDEKKYQLILDLIIEASFREEFTGLYIGFALPVDKDTAFDQYFLKAGIKPTSDFLHIEWIFPKGNAINHKYLKWNVIDFANEFFSEETKKNVIEGMEDLWRLTI